MDWVTTPVPEALQSSDASGALPIALQQGSLTSSDPSSAASTLSAVAPGTRAAAMIFASRFIRPSRAAVSRVRMRTPNSAVRPFERPVPGVLGRAGTMLSYAGDGI